MVLWAQLWIPGGMLVAFLAVAWRVVKYINRQESLHIDFPPHRHINGYINYPHEYEPSRIEKFGDVQ
jgi:hypothetical protein